MNFRSRRTAKRKPSKAIADWWDMVVLQPDRARPAIVVTRARFSSHLRGEQVTPRRPARARTPAELGGFLHTTVARRCVPANTLSADQCRASELSTRAVHPGEESEYEPHDARFVPDDVGEKEHHEGDES